MNLRAELDIVNASLHEKERKIAKEGYQRGHQWCFEERTVFSCEHLELCTLDF